LEGGRRHIVGPRRACTVETRIDGLGVDAGGAGGAEVGVSRSSRRDWPEIRPAESASLMNLPLALVYPSRSSRKAGGESSLQRGVIGRELAISSETVPKTQAPVHVPALIH
jgi:hypothetical protein